ncbi:aspartate aminotransferase family protein [Hymenobacter sp. BT664]|uniref:Aspartate aminotransferase family protein n=1 Tax=Hymenobacter montanus TaxID=2771359 RepID=A0A927GIB9_9BACT|nr:pyridoxal-dependent decarboxylase [Hymenobacter montanus]MBD2767288.1 aspartate aminotransferase family protein [Hymenobacter montanus]
MHSLLAADLDSLPTLLATARELSLDYLASLAGRPVALATTESAPPALPEEGAGGEAALRQFWAEYAPQLGASAGPRFLGFVTGGSTPAALAADWLVSAIDQNLSNDGYSVVPAIERAALHLLRQLFGLPAAFAGVFVTGATQSNLVGLAVARQWAAARAGHDVAQRGLYGLPPLPLLSGAAHSSIYKAAAILGLGRDQVRAVGQLPGREALDPVALEEVLRALNGQPAVVVANAGTVNSTDFDDLRALAALKEKYPFWLHVDAAFGGFAAVVPELAVRVAGWEHADSITIDAHKWLNVPYDAAMLFTRHPALQAEVFKNSAAYLGPLGERPDFVHLTPENSRRFRALPVYLSLLAYGRAGIADIVVRNCAQAAALGTLLEASPAFRLLAPVRLNVVCFTLTGPNPAGSHIKQVLERVRDSGEAFLTPTVYAGTPGIRAAFSNWRTELPDVARVMTALYAAVPEIRHASR